jgi:hypothetical protein
VKLAVFVLVAVWAGAEVFVAPDEGVFDGLGVREGVGEAPAVVAVAVAVSAGREVEVEVLVAVGVRVVVLVGVFVAGGASTLKEPLEVFTGMELASGAEATALLNDREEFPGAAPGRTLKITLATTPFGMASWFIPATMTRILPEDGCE